MGGKCAEDEWLEVERSHGEVAYSRRKEKIEDFVVGWRAQIKGKIEIRVNLKIERSKGS